jgi:hypothetical protein
MTKWFCIRFAGATPLTAAQRHPMENCAGEVARSTWQLNGKLPRTHPGWFLFPWQSQPAFNRHTSTRILLTEAHGS